MLLEPEFKPASRAIDAGTALEVRHIAQTNARLVVNVTGQVHPARLEHRIGKIGGGRVFPKVNQRKAVIYIGITLVAVCRGLIVVVEDIRIGRYVEHGISKCMETTIFTNVCGLCFLLEQADNLVYRKQDEQDGQQQSNFHEYHSLSSYNLFVQLVHILFGDAERHSSQFVGQIQLPVESIKQ